MTKNNNSGLCLADWNEHKVKVLARTDWRASLVPAAAVIPAPVAYIKVVAVKKLVVGRPLLGAAWQLRVSLAGWRSAAGPLP